MSHANDEKNRYPVGKFSVPDTINSTMIKGWIEEIENTPELVRKVVEDMSPEQLLAVYRPGSWTIEQLVHHIADSHMNAFIRLKLALTEDQPLIKPYMEDRWAELLDSKLFSVKDELVFIELLHKRWVILLQSLSEKDYAKTYNHPEQGIVRMDKYIGMYAWHSRHHLAHILLAANS